MADYRLRPSAASTWVRCSGFVRLAADVPEWQEDDSVEVREAGTACHWAAYRASQGADIPALLGETAPNGVEIDDDMLEAVDLYRDAVAAWPTAAIRYFEQPVHCADIHPECGGTPDVFAWDAATRTLYIGDLKYGFRFVAADGNWQLVCYVSGVMRFFMLRPEDVNHVVLMICQPRNPQGGGPIRDWVATPADLMPYWHQLQAAAIVALSNEAICTTNPGCAQCGAAGVCPALDAAALTVLDVSTRATPHDLTFTDAERQLRYLQWAESVVTARREALEQQVAHGIKKGKISKHYEVEQQYSRLKWNEGTRPNVEAMAALMGVSVQKPVQLITPTQAKKVLGDDVVSLFAQRLPGGLKLVNSDANKWRRIFGKP